MRSLRNLIYNTSDILVALIILAVAVLLIWSRIEVIMGYPGEGDTASQPQIEAGTGTDIDITVDTGATDMPADPENYLKVTIPDGSSNDVVAGLLKQAGIITETNDFINAIEGSQYNGAVVPGDHWIPKGADMNTVIQSLVITGMPGQAEAPAENAQ